MIERSHYFSVSWCQMVFAQSKRFTQSTVEIEMSEGNIRIFIFAYYSIYYLFLLNVCIMIKYKTHTH